jgi:hypothetical protein
MGSIVALGYFAIHRNQLKAAAILSPNFRNLRGLYYSGDRSVGKLAVKVSG